MGLFGYGPDMVSLLASRAEVKAVVEITQGCNYKGKQNPGSHVART